MSKNVLKDEIMKEALRKLKDLYERRKGGKMKYWDVTKYLGIPPDKEIMEDILYEANMSDRLRIYEEKGSEIIEFIDIKSSLENSNSIQAKCIISNERHCKAHSVNENLVFVIGSASSDFEDDIHRIKEVMKEFNLNPYFATKEDREKGLDAFCDKICSKILQSRFCVVLANSPKNKLVTTSFPPEKQIKTKFPNFPAYEKILYPSPNVWYEIGLAIGNGKRILPLFRKTSENLPFDVQHLDFDFFTSQKILEEKLRKTIPLLLSEPIRKMSLMTTREEIGLKGLDKKNTFENFMEWMESKCPSDFYTNPKLGGTPDSILICLIPDVYSENLVDFSAEYDKPYITKRTQYGGGISGGVSSFNIKSFPLFARYLDSYRLMRGYLQGNSVIVPTPVKIREYNKTFGNELIIYPTGVIYVLLNYSKIDKVKTPRSMKEEFIFSPRNLLDKIPHYGTILFSKESELYGTPTGELQVNNIEDILRILCFPFHPNCKEKIVHTSSDKFHVRFILPGMLIGKNQEPRKLHEKEPYYLGRYYVGDDPTIIYDTQFRYSEISRVIAELKSHIMGFFHERTGI